MTPDSEETQDRPRRSCLGGVVGLLAVLALAVWAGFVMAPLTGAQVGLPDSVGRVA
jgi:hypothetical protein